MPRFTRRRRVVRRRKAPMRRRGRRGGARRTGRSGFPMPTGGGNMMTLNRSRGLPTMTVSRTNTSANTVAPGSGISQNIFFDPSGTYSTIDGSAPSTAMNDWTSFVALYDQYKVNYMRLTYTLEPAAGTAFNTQQVRLYARYNYDSSFTSASATSMAQLQNCKVYTFSQEQPKVTFKVYPRVDILTYNQSGSLATEGVSISKMKWTDVNYPVRLNGFIHYIPSLPAGWGITLDCEYNVSFRYQK